MSHKICVLINLFISQGIVSADNQEAKLKIAKTEADLLEIQTKIFVLFKIDVSNLNWYEDWSFVWRQRITQLKYLLYLEEKCRQLLESVMATKTSEWKQSSISTLTDAIETIVSLSPHFLRIFQQDFDELIHVLKVLNESGSKDQISQLNKLFETYSENSNVHRITWKLSLALHKVQVRINVIETEVNSLMKSTGKSTKITFLRDKNLIKAPIQQLISDGIIENSNRYLISLRIGMTSMIEDTVNECPTMSSYQKLNSKYNGIQKSRSDLRSKDKRMPNCFDEWIIVTRQVDLLVCAFLDMLDSASSIRKKFQRKDDPEKPNSMKKAEIEILTDDAYNEFMLNLNVVKGVLKCSVREVWTLFDGQKTNEMWKFMEHTKVVPETMMKKALDDQPKTAREQALAKTNDLLHLIQDTFQPVVDIVQDVGKTGKIDLDHVNISNNYLVKIILEFEKDRHYIDELVEYQSKLIDSLDKVRMQSLGFF